MGREWMDVGSGAFGLSHLHCVAGLAGVVAWREAEEGKLTFGEFWHVLVLFLEFECFG